MDEDFKGSLILRRHSQGLPFLVVFVQQVRVRMQDPLTLGRDEVIIA
jgi:hypothetical protein